MRLFTGIDLPGELNRSLARLVERLRPAARIKWSPPDNFHITTKFIGEWPESRLAELVEALRTIPPRPAVDITVGGLGWFPNPRAPRVFWVGIDGGSALKELARNTEQALIRLGIAAESKPFSPHLTLARIKEPAPLEKLHLAISQLPATEFGSFAADRFYLYLSRRSAAGSVYTKLEEFKLSAP